MAVVRPNRTCTFCGHQIEFIYNQLTKEQMESGWCGDQGGDYEDHDCKVQRRESKLNTILGVTQSQAWKDLIDRINKINISNQKQ
jgi:hypothetical protein